ncbi:redox-active disulfide protein 2 [Aminomonas paucivorans DSM 12260]|uniref:Redox-active disulfide protein 2 n=1 Tax=Aminomonas paucivorans DSM 12260 TaxID=584708 RepID=E3CWN4_9BACT|nr:thioredoxin family protein [Aminomonas paucivorans]EFQ22539.1 redox-active disulfide protein 2 [Aminomonas paucivorans DSM 12260]
MKIEVLGMGCAKCTKLEENARAAVAALGIEATIEHVKDMDRILDYGVMITPGLVVDGKVVASGKVPSSEDIQKLIQG